MESRIVQMKELLERKGLEAAVLKLPENLVLFSRYWPRNGFSFVFVHRSGRAVLVVPEGEQDDPERGSIRDIRRFAWGRLGDGDPWTNVAAVFGKLKKEFAVSEGAGIGIDANADAFGPNLCCGELMPMGRRSLDLIQEAFGKAELVELMPEIIALRIVKLPEEIERIELANEIAHVGVEAFVKAVGTGGAREIDVAAEVEAVVMRAGSGHRGRVRYARAIAQISSGRVNTAAAWFSGMVTTDRVIERGDFVMLEMGVMADGYWSDLTKTVVAGIPDARQAEMLEAVEDAQSSAIAAICPGAIAGEVDRVARSRVEARGLGKHFFHNLGHGTGIAYHDGGPFFAPGSKTVLKEGMIHSCEPGVYIEGVGGVRQEVNVLVTARGARMLGRSSTFVSIL